MYYYIVLITYNHYSLLTSGPYEIIMKYCTRIYKRIINFSGNINTPLHVAEENRNMSLNNFKWFTLYYYLDTIIVYALYFAIVVSYTVCIKKTLITRGVHCFLVD